MIVMIISLVGFFSSLLYKLLVTKAVLNPTSFGFFVKNRRYLRSQTMPLASHERNTMNPNDDIWAFERKVSQECHDPSSLPQPYFDSTFGRTYVIDLNTQNCKQVKTLNQCANGESNTRYVFNLGSLKMKLHDNNGRKRKILSLHKHKIWWMRPSFLGNDKNVNDHVTVLPETIFLLGLATAVNTTCNEDLYRLVLPLVVIEPEMVGSTSCSLRSSSTTAMSVELHSETGGKVALYCGLGPDPDKLIEDAMQMASFCSGNHVDDVDSTTFEQIESKLLPFSVNTLPSFAKNLGWCTWNAFYTQLSGEKIISAVKMLQEKSIPVKWIIIDDGWQHTTNDEAVDGMQWGERLLSTNQSSPSKFPVKEETHNKKKFVRQMSLKDTVSELKAPKVEEQISANENNGMGLKAVLAWHALPGYWLGLASNEESREYSSPDATMHYPHFSSNIIENDVSLLREKSIIKGIGIADDIEGFYNEYHSFLQSTGFDGVKVDAQGVSGFLRPHQSYDSAENPYEHRHQVSHQMQDALAASINQRFSKQDGKDEKDISSPPCNIMCMCHSLEIIYRMPHLYGNSKPLMRASDDFYPENDFCHGPHLVACAFNSLLLGHLATPDWDMFTTESTLTGEMHAIARAISGGPIYFSDKPEQLDSCIVKRLVCENGTILPCLTYARPIRDSLLNDPLDEESDPLIVWNVNGHFNETNTEITITSGLIAIFYLAASGSWCYDSLDFVEPQVLNQIENTKLVKIRPDYIEPFHHQSFQNQKFIALSFQDGILGVLASPTDFIEVKVHHLKSTLIHMLPIYEASDAVGLFPIGYANLYNFAGAVKKISLNSNDDPNCLKATIRVNGCGDFLIGYKTKAHLNQIQVSVNGYDADNWLINPIDGSNKPPILIPEELFSSCKLHKIHLGCIKIPCQKKDGGSVLVSIKILYE